MRSTRVVVRAALIAALAAVAVPALAASRSPSLETAAGSAAFSVVGLHGRSPGSATTTFLPDPAHRSNGTIDGAAVLADGAPSTRPSDRLTAAQPASRPVVVVVNPWWRDPAVSFYGPGFYGKGTACGLAYTTSLMGVAHRTLPCGTLVTFRNPANGMVITVPVIDRGPYVSGREWDLSGAACLAIDHCYTGPILWKLP